MKISKAITTIIAVATLTAFANANPEESQSKHRISAGALANKMLEGFDNNKDQALNITELESAIDGIYDLRNERIRNRRDSLIANGSLSEEKADQGFITFSPDTTQVAEAMLEEHDINENGVLENHELITSVNTLRKFNLGRNPKLKRDTVVEVGS